jgi:hypothetical protein
MMLNCFMLQDQEGRRGTRAVVCGCGEGSKIVSFIDCDEMGDGARQGRNAVKLNTSQKFDTSQKFQGKFGKISKIAVIFNCALATSQLGRLLPVSANPYVPDENGPYQLRICYLPCALCNLIGKGKFMLDCYRKGKARAMGKLRDRN